MTLTPITRHAPEARIIAWDLEWHPETCALRLAGVYDGESVRQYLTIGDFLGGELTADHAGAWYYAHAGGLYDLEFVLDYIIERASGTYQVSAAFSGASAVIATISDGAHKWTFVDSFWTLRDSLAKIGKSIGMPKGDCAFTAPLSELREYNAQDCRILWHALDRFQREVNDLGGALRKTIASTALDLIRRKYLQSEIPTNRHVNETLRDSYIGGRVEVFGNYGAGGYVYDINSSFPKAMSAGPLPGKLTRQYKARDRRTSQTYFAEVTIRVPDDYAPPLPYRHDGSIYYPAGTWRAWFAGVELEYAESCGAEVVAWHQCYDFEPRDDLAPFAEQLYAARAAETDDFRRMTYKLLMNSGYGKFGESRQKESLAIHPDAATLLRYPRLSDLPRSDLPRHERGCWRRLLAPGVWVLSEDRPVPHEHVPIAAWITARARTQLHRPLAQCLARGHAVWYADTDSIATSDPDVPTGPGLGEMKLEKIIDYAHFAAPKLYHLEARDPVTGAQTDVIRAKGFSRSREAPLEWGAVISGATYERPAMPRIRRLLSSGDSTPRLETTTRSVHLERTRPKRAPLHDDDRPGATRPWYVSELVGAPWKPRDPRPPTRLPARARAIDLLLGTLDDTPRDYLRADDRYREWRSSPRRGRGPRPVYEGGELDPINEALSLRGDRRVSGLIHGLTLLLEGTTTWAEVTAHLDTLRQIPGLEAIREPEAAIAAYVWERAEREGIEATRQRLAPVPGETDYQETEDDRTDLGACTRPASAL